jgi:hypothetical protein
MLRRVEQMRELVPIDFDGPILVSLGEDVDNAVDVEEEIWLTLYHYRGIVKPRLPLVKVIVICPEWIS